MNYGNQNLRELLAGEYVLGLLRGAARRRFERLLIEDARLRAEVTVWEEKFAAWNRGLRPLAPPTSVWRRLQARIEAESRPVRAPRVKVWWSGAVAVAAVVILVVGIFLGRSVLAPSLPPAYLAVMSTAQGQPRWLITVHPQSRRVNMKALANNTPPPGKSYELWMLPGSGKPIAMGLMNSSGSASETVSVEVIAAVVSAKGLAISVEPEGGSPTGQPTGPVVYVASLVPT
ncbi:MAG: anti-sigma factor [Gammaproteobacteria bacterium]